MIDNGSVTPLQHDPPRFLCWIHGQCLFASNAHALVAFAASHGVDVFVVWEVDYQEEEMVHLLASSTGEQRWEFLDGAGNVRFTLGGALHDWSMAFIDALGPLQAIAVPRHVWDQLDHHPLYAPLGFCLPTLHPSGWMFRWCPDITAQRIAVLNQDEREAVLGTMYARLIWWTEMRELEPDERERQLDIRMIEMAHETGHPGWRLINQVLASALGQP